jgi:hypothetical protein
MRVNTSPYHCREAFVAGLYGLRTVSFQGAPSGSGKSMLGHSQLDVLALHRDRVRGVFGEGGLCEEQTKADEKYDTWYGGPPVT